MNRNVWGIALGVCMVFGTTMVSTDVAGQEATADDAAAVGARLERVIQGMLDGQLPPADVVESLLEATDLHEEPVSFGPVRAVRFLEAGERRSYAFEVEHENTKARWWVWLKPGTDLISNYGWKRLYPPDASIQPGVFGTGDSSVLVALTQEGDSIWVSTETRRLEYRRQPDGEFHYVDDPMYWLAIIDPVTVERFSVGNRAASERLLRQNGAAAQPVELREGYFTYEQSPEIVAVVSLLGDTLITAHSFSSMVGEYKRRKDGTYAHTGGWVRIVNPYTIDIYSKTSSGALDPKGPQRLFRSGDVSPTFVANARERDRRMRQQLQAEEARYQAAQNSQSSGDTFGAALMTAMGAYADATADNERMRRSLEEAAKPPPARPLPPPAYGAPSAANPAHGGSAESAGVDPAAQSEAPGSAVTVLLWKGFQVPITPGATSNEGCFAKVGVGPVTTDASKRPHEAKRAAASAEQQFLAACRALGPLGSGDFADEWYIDEKAESVYARMRGNRWMHEVSAR